MALVVCIVCFQLICAFYNFLVQRMFYMVFDGNHDSLIHLIADNFAHASFSKISFFHDIFLLITQLRLPSGQ